MPHQTETSHEPCISSPTHAHRFNQAGGVDHPLFFGGQSRSGVIHIQSLQKWYTEKSDLFVKLDYQQARFDKSSISRVVNRRCDCVKIISIISTKQFFRFRGALRPCIRQGQAWNAGLYL